MSDSVIKHAYLENEDSDMILAFAADICDSVEKTAVATEAHAKNSWFYSVPVRRLCKATSDIAIGANIVPGNGGNCIAQTIEELMASAINFGDFATTSNVTISGVTYHTYWEVAPTSSNQTHRNRVRTLISSTITKEHILRFHMTRIIIQQQAMASKPK